ncbi:MAG: transposase [Sphaerochaeta sp.]|nr:transposase [Sphaerochaeta sp.]
MYIDTLVDMPDIPGKIVIQRKKDSAYVHYEYDRVYDPTRKFNVPKRVVIGKVSGKDGGKMHPNQNYLKHFPSAQIPSARASSSRSCCMRIGPWMAIRSIIAHYGLQQIIVGIAGGEAGFLLDLAAYSLVSENNAGQYYPDYAYCHPLFTDGMRIYSDSKVSDFLSTMPEHWSVDFLDVWNARADHRERIYISYDSTNKNCQAGEITMVEYGHPKDDKGLPVFNYSIAYDRTNRIPLFYEDYPGSIVDVSQLQFMLQKASSYGYRRCGFILDRGYFCKANIQFMDRCGYDFVIMVKGMKELVSTLVLEHKGSFESNRSCFIRGHRIYGKTVKIRLYAEDGSERFFHIFYSTSLQHSERDEFEVRLERMGKFLTKNLQKSVAPTRPFHHYYELYLNEKTKALVHWKEKADVIEEELDLCGYFCIITSEKMPAQEALDLYKGRDASEKLFRSDKSYLGNKSLRICSQESAEAKVFIEFVALIIRNRMYTLLKDAMERMGKRPNFMTVPAALKELGKIEMVRQFDGVYRLDHALTKTQKVIMEALGLDKNNVDETALLVSSALGSEAYAAIDCDVETEEDEYGENEDS